MAQAKFHSISQIESQYRQFLITIPVLLFLGAILEELILCIAPAAGAIFSNVPPALMGVYFPVHS